MKEAIAFLMLIYGREGCISDMANIQVAQAENDYETIEEYLMFVHDYTGRLINRLKEEQK